MKRKIYKNDRVVCLTNIGIYNTNGLLATVKYVFADKVAIEFDEDSFKTFNKYNYITNAFITLIDNVEYAYEEGINYDQIHIEIKNRILDLKDIIYNEYDCVGGHLHLVLDDGNISDYDIQWCLDNTISKIKDNKERQVYIECAKLLLMLSYSARKKLLNIV